MTGIPTRRGNLDPGDTGRMPCEERGRNWSDMSAHQGMPKIASSNQKLGERHGTDFPSEPPVGANTANTLILDFEPPGWERINFCCFTPLKSVVLCYSSPREVILRDYGICSLANCISFGPNLAMSTNGNNHCFGAITLPKPWTLRYTLFLIQF